VWNVVVEYISMLDNRLPELQSISTGTQEATEKRFANVEDELVVVDVYMGNGGDVPGGPYTSLWSAVGGGENGFFGAGGRRGGHYSRGIGLDPYVGIPEPFDLPDPRPLPGLSGGGGPDPDPFGGRGPVLDPFGGGGPDPDPFGGRGPKPDGGSSLDPDGGPSPGDG
jgi:hypothetical protein